MRYVGLTALGIVFWADVILLRMVLTHHCAPEELAREVAATREAERSQEARLRHRWRRRGAGAHHAPSRRGDEVMDVDVPSWNHDDDFPLSKTALVRGLNEVRPLVQACYARFAVPGTAMVNVVIAKRGHVASAAVTGKFAGTPTGACVEAAVKRRAFRARTASARLTRSSSADA